MSVIVFTTGELTSDLEEFLKMKGIHVGTDHRAVVALKQVCPQYNEQTKRCEVYDKRPKICIDFPTEFSQIVLKDPQGNWFSPCSYYWDLDTEADIEIDLFELAKEAESAVHP